MSTARKTPLWAGDILPAIAGNTLRPGGLELTDHACMLAGMRPGWKVLDMGCGLGTTVRHLRARHAVHAVGLEKSISQLVREERNTLGRAPLVCACGNDLPFAENTFNMVLCECVLSLFSAPESALLEIARVLRPGSWLAVSDLYIRCREDLDEAHEHREISSAKRSTETTLSLEATGATGTTRKAGQATAGHSTAGHSTAGHSTAGQAAATEPGKINTQDRANEANRSTGAESCAAGAMTMSSIRQHMESAGFTVVRVEDHSRLLTELAAQLIMAGESLPCSTAQTGQAESAVSESGSGSAGCPAKGYFLLLARRNRTTRNSNV